LWQINKALRPYVSQSAADGALPTLFAATSPGGEGRQLLRPERVLRAEGAAGAGEDHAARERLRGGGMALDISASLTGVSFDPFAVAA